MAKRTITPEPRSAQEKSSHNVRQLKVLRGYYERYTPKIRRARIDYRPPITVPQVLLKGRWLENAGFAIDSSVNVEVEDGRLVITPKFESIS